MFTGGISTFGNTAGTTGTVGKGVLFVGGTNITLSQSITDGNVTISIIGGAGGEGGSFSAGVSNIGNTSGNTGTVSNQIVFAGGNNVTLSQSTAAGGATVTISGPNTVAQSVVPGIQSISGGTTRVTTGEVVFSNSNGVSFGIDGATVTATVATNYQSAGAYLTTAMLSNAVTLSNIRVSAGTTSNLLSAVTFSNSNGISFGMDGSTVTATVKTDYLTTAALSNHSHGNPTLNLTNLSGTTASNSAGLTLSLSAAAPGAGGAINFSAGTTSSNLDSVVFSNSNGVTFGLNASTITASVNAGGAAPAISHYMNLMPQNSVAPYASIVIPFNTLVLQPLHAGENLGFPGDMTISTWLMHLSGSITATASSSSFSSSFFIGLYTMANSTQLSLVNSVSTTFSKAAATANSTVWGGPRFLSIHSSQWSAQPVLANGSRYWWGVLVRSSNFSGAQVSFLGQYIGASTTRSGTWGVSQVTHTSKGMAPFLGILSASTSAIPGSIAASAVNKAQLIAGFSPGIVLDNLGFPY